MRPPLTCLGLVHALSFLACTSTSDPELQSSEQDAAVSRKPAAQAGSVEAPHEPAPSMRPSDAGHANPPDADLPMSPPVAAVDGNAVVTAPGEAEDAGPALPQDSAAPPEPAQPCSQELQTLVGNARPDFGPAPTLPALSAGGDPNDNGAYAVWRMDVVIANPDATRSALDATFYAPSQDEGRSIATGQFALVLVMHGYGLTHQAYEGMSTHIASHGFVVLGLTLPFSLTAAHDKNAAEALAAIDFALSSAAPTPLHTHIDPQKIAAAGHSLGGKIAFYAAALDARIDLVIAWDPSNAGGPPCFIDSAACNDFPVAPNCLAMQAGVVHQLRAESLVFRAAADGANPEPAHNAIHFFRGAPAPATLIDFDTRAQHGDWANPDSAVVPHTRRVQVAILRQRFYQHTGLESWLPQGAQISEGAARALYKP